MGEYAREFVIMDTEMQLYISTRLVIINEIDSNCIYDIKYSKEIYYVIFSL